MEEVNYSSREILRDDNLIFDLKTDIAFKNLFLNINNFSYLEEVFSILLGRNICNLKLCNSEIPTNKLKTKSIQSDLVFKYDDEEIIVEMNKFKTNNLVYKNNSYLLKEHAKKLCGKNCYGKRVKTILVNFDNFDVLKKNKFIYYCKLFYYPYNTVLYNNIEIININLVYLKKKYYNKYRLNELEKMLLIFVEQRKDKLLKIIKNDNVKELINFMYDMMYDENYITTYDKEIFERNERQEFNKMKKKLKKQLKQSEIKLEASKVKLQESEIRLQESEIKLQDADNKLKEADNIMRVADNRMQDADNRMQDADNKLKDANNKFNEALMKEKQVEKERKDFYRKMNNYFKKLGISAKEIM